MEIGGCTRRILPSSSAQVEHLGFQEYHASYPHVKYTLGFAGRPGGPAWYISPADPRDPLHADELVGGGCTASDRAVSDTSRQVTEARPLYETLFGL